MNQFPADEPEDNSEQDEEGAQAQDVAQSARDRATDISEDSEHGGRSNPAQVTPDDAPDLVDRMNDMVRSGRIDTDAFAGEPQMDDEEDALGPTEDED
ncbi:hypothetical protein [Sphingobium cloacae]|uniref:hypothetical protein n=1 Tax=Sphingobium cloacae TaxID=120107 RepID=UPI00082EAC3D|nr:hypothetical protein [Sphingobium cloacae]